MARWSDADVQKLLAFKSEEQIAMKFTGKLEDNHLLEQFTKRLEELGF